MAHHFVVVIVSFKNTEAGRTNRESGTFQQGYWPLNMDNTYDNALGFWLIKFPSMAPQICWQLWGWEGHHWTNQPNQLPQQKNQEMIRRCQIPFLQFSKPNSCFAGVVWYKQLLDQLSNPKHAQTTVPNTFFLSSNQPIQPIIIQETLVETRIARVSALFLRIPRSQWQVSNRNVWSTVDVLKASAQREFVVPSWPSQDFPHLARRECDSA